MLKTIITRKDNIITNIALVTEVVSNGLLVDNEYIIAGIENYNVFENVETLDTIVGGKFIYTVENGFVVNTGYVEILDANAEITKLKAELLDANTRIGNTENVLNMVLETL